MGNSHLSRKRPTPDYFQLFKERKRWVNRKRKLPKRRPSLNNCSACNLWRIFETYKRADCFRRFEIDAFVKNGAVPSNGLMTKSGSQLFQSEAKGQAMGIN